MTHENEKYFTSHSHLRKIIIWKVRYDVRKLRKTPQISYDPRKLTV